MKNSPKKIVCEIPTDLTGVVHYEDEDGNVWKPAPSGDSDLTCPPPKATVFRGYIFT